MPSDGLRIGVVGVGRIGAFHARTLAAHEAVSSVVLADTDMSRANSLAGELGIEIAATAEAVVAAGVDALVIATSTPGHVPLLQLAARAGLPAFCEKPVALELATMDGVLEEVERAGIVVQIGFQRRFDAGFRAARDLVAAGQLGTMLILRAATHDPAPPPLEYVGSSGGIFRDLSIHDFDAVRFVAGEDVAEVYADGAVRETAWFEELGDVDTSVAILRLSGGALAIVSGSRRNPLGYDVRLEVLGTSDAVIVGLDERSPIRSVEPRATPLPGPRYQSFLERFAPAYRDELAAFATTVRNGGPSLCSLQDARAALVVALAADRSRAEHRPVSTREIVFSEEVAPT